MTKLFFNATVLIILSSSLFASIATERFGKKLSIISKNKKEEQILKRIMVTVSNPNTMHNLVSIANSFQEPGSAEQIYVLNIVNDDYKVKENLLEIRKNLEENLSDYNNLRENMRVITRIDLNVSSGILRSAKEYQASDIVFGWSEKKEYFGKVVWKHF
ncbi:MAG: hypothetical protein HC831_00495 [Chloroflexia bacterium]|nr:hypothetical protein [Chloroflexia bacterium]